MAKKTDQQKHEFQAEVKKLLHLVTHSLYSNKEVFIRELVSNASDAAEKLRFESLSNSKLLKQDTELKIWIDIDKKARTITIRDNGIGMSQEEAINHLGTIAKSGTEDFLAAMTGDSAKDSALIGQFGVGFYSSFVVSRKVIVNSRRADMAADQGVCWTSLGEGDYTVKMIEKPDRGTEIILYLKEGEDEFLDSWRIRQLVTKYSDHILLPIVMKKEKVDTPSEDEDKNKDEDKGEGDKAAAAEKEPEDEVVNSATALWTLPRNKIKDEDYQALYKHISHDHVDCLAWAHNRVEGKLEYITLIYLPEKAGFDLWNRDVVRGLKLYVKRVFIMDDAEQLLPMYLRFVKGVVDSNDLPLNVSRELLQNNKVIAAIRAGCIKRVLTMLADLAKKEQDKYKAFWMEFGQVLKEGIAEDYANRDKIADLLRFSSTDDASAGEQVVSLADYVSRMGKDQDKIYYVIADSYLAAKNSPHLEIFRDKGIEVLLLHDRIDEWLTAHLTEFDGKPLHSIAKGDVDLGDKDTDEDKKAKKKTEDDFASLVKQMQDVLKDEVKEVKISHRLTDSPVCLVADAQDMSGHLQRIMREMGQDVPMVKPVLELNPDHILIQRLKSEQDDSQFSEWSHVLFEQALLAEGGKLKDPGTFVKRMNALMAQLL